MDGEISWKNTLEFGKEYLRTHAFCKPTFYFYFFFSNRVVIPILIKFSRNETSYI